MRNYDTVTMPLLFADRSKKSCASIAVSTGDLVAGPSGGLQPEHVIGHSHPDPGPSLRAAYHRSAIYMVRSTICVFLK
jgi:hypothetical protein